MRLSDTTSAIQLSSSSPPLFLTLLVRVLLLACFRPTSSLVIRTHQASQALHHSFTMQRRQKKSLMNAKSVEINEAVEVREILPHEAKGFIFDIDGTLADSWKLGYDATQVVLKNNNIPLIDEDLYHECTRYSTPDRLARHAGLDPDKDEEFWTVGGRLADEFDKLYVGLVSTETAGFYEGVEDLILKIPNTNEGVRVAALTNACVAYAHAVLKTNCPKTRGELGAEGIYERFLSIHGADTVPNPKPNPDGLLLCCKEIGISPDECVYIGDSPSDAVAAKAAGSVAIGVLWGSHPIESLKKAPFDYLCNDIDELKRLLMPEN